MRIKNIIFVLLAVLALFIGFTFTSQFRAIILNMVVSRVDSTLEADFSVGKLSGSIIRSLKLHDITVTKEGRQLLQIDSISLRYSLRYLLNKEIKIEHIIIDNLSLNAEYSDGEWNLLQIVKQQDKTEPEDDKPFAWTISLDSFKIQDTNINITTDHMTGNSDQGFDFLPSSISGLVLEFSLQYEEDNATFDLSTFKCMIDWPNGEAINLKSLNFTLIKDKEELYAKDFVMKTDNTQIDIFSNINTDYDLKHQTTMDIVFHNLQDVALFVPQVEADESISISLAVMGDRETIHIEKRLFIDDSLYEDFRMIVKASFDDISNILNKPSDELPIEVEGYEVSVFFNQLKPMKFVKAITDQVMINGIILITGDSVDIVNGHMNLKMNLSYSQTTYADYPQDKYEIDNTYYIDSFQLEANLKDGALSSRTTIEAGNESLAVLQINAASFPDLLGSVAEGADFRGLADYSLDVALNKFDIAAITINDDHSTNLNLNANIKGGEDKTDIVLNMDKSVIADLTIDKINLEAFIDPQEIVLDTMNVLIDKTNLGLNGNIIDDEVYLGYYISFNNAESIVRNLTEITQPLNINGVLAGNLQGTVDSLRLEGSLNLKDSSFGNVSGVDLQSRFLLMSLPHKLQGNLEFDLNQGLIDEIEIQRIGILSDVDIVLSDNDADFFEEILAGLTIEVEQDQDHSITAEVELSGNNEVFNLRFDLMAQIQEHFWQTERGAASISYIPDKFFEIDSFRFYSDNQSVELNGVYSLDTNQENDLYLRISNLDLAKILSLMENDLPVEGSFDLDINLSGSSNSPVIAVISELSNAGYEDLKGFNFSTKIDYPYPDTVSFNYIPEYEVLAGTITIDVIGEPLADLTLFTPVKIDLDSGIELYTNVDSYLLLQTVPLDLTKLDPLVDAIDNLTGNFTIRLEAQDKLITYTDLPQEITTTYDEADPKQPYIKLNLNIENAGLRVHELGTRYHDVNFIIIAENDILEIKKGFVRSGEGSVTIDASIPLTDAHQSVSFNLRAENFPAIANEALDILINSNIALSGNVSEPRFTGNVSIPRGRINLNALMQDGTAGAGEMPLLAEVQKKDVQLETVDPDTESPQINIPEVQTEIDFFDDAINNSRGTINVSFPRNVWVRSPEANIELRADLQIVKRDAHFEIFGSVNTIRGFYVFYGRRFQIITGEVSFAGGRQINPHVDFTLEYNFRGIDQGRNTLKLIVSGSMEEIDIAFELNNNPIEETDAISYIIFGRSFEQLTRGEKAEATNQAVVLGSVIANQLAGVVTDVVGETFSLDMIEFRSDTASSQVGVEIGKYLTDKLFVSLKRDFNLTNSGESVAEEVVVEYEIRPYLFLQARKGDDRDSGLDLIWRLSWE